MLKKSEKNNLVELILPKEKLLPSKTTQLFFEQFSSLDQTLNILESHHGVLLVPSYVGLRKALGCLAQIMQREVSSDKIKNIDLVEAATSELLRAKHDALRVVINYSHYKLLLIENRYGSESILQVCPEFYDIREEMDEINEKLSSDFENIAVADDYFKFLESDYIIRLLRVHDRMTKAGAIALNDIKQKNKREENYKLLAIAGFAVGICGLLLAIIPLFVGS